MKVAVLGAGAGGASAAVDLGRQGHRISLWSRSPAAVDGFISAGGIRHEGVLGNGLAPLHLITTDLALAAQGVDVLLVCLPTLAHASIAALVIAKGLTKLPVILNPGHSGGALEFAAVFQRSGLTPPPIAEFSTLTYVARKPAPDRVRTTGRAKAVWVAALPRGAIALQAACALYDCARRAPNVLATALSNVNMVLHPPGAILGAAWVEATHGNFTFYVDGLTDGVARVMEALDNERCAVGAAFGLELPVLFDEMRAIGTIEADADPARGLASAIRGGRANACIMAPGDFDHRYYREDFWYGLQPLLAFAEIGGVNTPIARSLYQLGRTLLGNGSAGIGRSAAAMGIAGLSRDELLVKVADQVNA